MERSEKLDQLSTAMAKVQAEITDPERNAKNAFFKDESGKASTYATLDACMKVARPLLAKNGLALIMSPVTDGTMAGIEWLLSHQSGQFLSDRLMMAPSKGTPQGVGAALTYARRYLISALTGMASEPDDDGTAASNGHQEPAQPAQPATRTAKPPAAPPKQAPKPDPKAGLIAAIKARMPDIDAEATLPALAAYALGEAAGVPADEPTATYLAAVIASMDPDDAAEIATSGRLYPPGDLAPRWAANMVAGRMKASGVLKKDNLHNIAMWAGVPTANYAALTRSEVDAIRRLILSAEPPAIKRMAAEPPTAEAQPDGDPFADE